MATSRRRRIRRTPPCRRSRKLSISGFGIRKNQTAAPGQPSKRRRRFHPQHGHSAHGCRHGCARGAGSGRAPGLRLRLAARPGQRRPRERRTTALCAAAQAAAHTLCDCAVLALLWLAGGAAVTALLFNLEPAAFLNPATYRANPALIAAFCRGAAGRPFFFFVMASMIWRRRNCAMSPAR